MCLASSSPRRRELLDQLGIIYETFVTDLPEKRLDNESPGDFVKRMSLEKAKYALVQRKAESRETLPVLGADTIVVLEDNVMGKPVDRAHARQMLESLSNQTHEVLSGVSLVTKTLSWSRMSRSKVTFCELSESAISSYLDTEEPYDKAGAYGIQGCAAAFIRKLEGSYSGVVGLPLHELKLLLTDSDLLQL